MRRRRLLRGVAALALASYFFAFAGGLAAAASTTSSNTTSSSKTTSSTTAASTTPANTHWVGVAQTVLANTSSAGKITGTPNVFTQWSANGSGPHTLKVPMSVKGFRNLSGFGKPPITDGYAVWNMHLTGPTNERTVATFPTDKLPLQVSVAYELNGKKINAQHIVGKTGELKVSYVITNTTTKPTTVTFKNALGATETTTVKVPVPVAAAFSVTIPAAFTDVHAEGASASGNGNGTSGLSWTLFLFDPLGGVKQSVSYQAHVTDAVVPSATLDAAVLPPSNVKPLPAIKEPGAPAVPTVTLGNRLAKLQTDLQAKLADLSSKASNALSNFKKVAVPAVQTVSGNAATLAGNLPGLSANAQTVSTNADAASTSLAQAATEAADHATEMGAISGGLGQEATDAAGHARGAADVQGGLAQAAGDAADAVIQVHNLRLALEALPASVTDTVAYKLLHAKLVALEARLIAHAAHLTVIAVKAKELEIGLIGHAARLAGWAVRAKVLEALMIAHSDLLAKTSAAAANVLAPAAATASTNLLGLVPKANDLSTKAAQTAATLANITLPGQKKAPKAIQSKQVGGGAHLDKAVGQLDASITSAANKVDSGYANLTALEKRAGENQLPAGNAIGATVQAGAFSYSISGANDVAHQTHLAAFIGGFALVLGIAFGIGLYRIRRGMPSSLAPPKAAPAKG